jgi:hypothetical protein
MLTWSTKYPSLRRWFGDSEASRLVQASEQAVADIAGFCQQHAIDADIRLGGAVYAASNPAQIGRLAPVLSMLQEHGSIAGPPCPRPKPARSVVLPCCRTATARRPAACNRASWYGDCCAWPAKWACRCMNTAP